MTAPVFADRMTLLRHRTGRVLMRGTVTVDQVYAHYQHEHLEFRHPRGGQAKYLESPLLGHYRDYLESYARTVLDDGGQDAFKRAVEHLSDQVKALAPVEFRDLRRSGHPVVSRDGQVTYDRPPEVHRLTDEELRIKSRIRYAGLPDRLKGWIWWHISKHAAPPPRRH